MRRKVHSESIETLYFLDFFAKGIREESILDPTHQLVCLLSKTQGDDLEIQSQRLLIKVRLMLANLQYGVRYEPNGQRIPCKLPTHPLYGWSCTGSQIHLGTGYRSGCTCEP
jgi:hypothetical protein